VDEFETKEKDEEEMLALVFQAELVVVAIGEDWSRAMDRGKE